MERQRSFFKMKTQHPLHLFIELSKVFNEHAHKLYVVGGTSRDYLLNIPFEDYDFATTATPNEMRDFLKDADYRFAKFGTVILKMNYHKVEITTLREEGKYTDFRHPAYIRFVKNPQLDYKRRDLTINALYIDESLDVLDFTNGQRDLERRTIRMIGNPIERFNEDPLRIIRTLRLAAKLNFKIEEDLSRAIRSSAMLLKYLNPNKVKEELQKIDIDSYSLFESLLNEHKVYLQV